MMGSSSQLLAATGGADGGLVGAIGVAASTQTMEQLYLWLGISALALLVLGMAAAWVLRRLREQGDQQELTVGFTLADLQRMRDQGQLTDQEFDRARGRMLARMRQVAAGDEGGAGGEALGGHSARKGNEGGDSDNDAEESAPQRPR